MFFLFFLIFNGPPSFTTLPFFLLLLHLPPIRRYWKTIGQKVYLKISGKNARAPSLSPLFYQLNNTQVLFQEQQHIKKRWALDIFCVFLYFGAARPPRGAPK